MKYLIRFLTVGVALLSISCSNKDSKIKDELKMAADKMNQLGPQVINENIRLDSVSATGNSIFKYNYTLLQDSREKVTEAEINLFKSEAKENAINTVKTSPDMQIFRDNNISLKYIYYDKHGKLTAYFSVNPSEYNK